MERTSPGWRVPLAIILVVLNLVLIAANLNKHDIFPFNDDSPVESVSGGTTSSSPPDSTTDATAENQADDEDDEQASTTDDPGDVDDWPGGRGPVPEGPPEPRRVLLSADRTAQVTGSAPSWATATQMADYVAANLGADTDAVGIELTWHPDAAVDVQSGSVVIDQAATFSLGQADIDPASLPTLDFVADLLRNRQSLFVVVIGHTDNVGDQQLNAELALTRAEAVVAYLTEAGVVPAQMVLASAGEDAPVAANDTPEGRQFNRRIELQFKNFLVAPGEVG